MYKNAAHPIHCLCFELKSELQGSTIKGQLVTDLPAGVEVELAASRYYLDKKGEQCLWMAGDETALLQKADDGATLANFVIDISAGDKDAFKFFRSINRGLTIEEAKLSDEIEVEARVMNTKHSEKILGRDLRDLVGPLVVNGHTINELEVKNSIFSPFKADKKAKGLIR